MPSLHPWAPRSAEQEALLWCAGVDRPKHLPTHLARMLARDFDWPQFGRAAAWHGVLPQVLGNLPATGTSCPPPLLKEWQTHTRLQRLDNLRRCAELIVLQRALDAAGIAFVAFKGPALAAAWYGDVGLRAFLDLDLLVRPSDALRAVALLTQLGYRKALPLHPRWEQHYLQNHGEMTFLRNEPAGVVDLHCRLLGMGYTFAAEPPDLWDRPDHVRIGSTTIPTLNAENTLIFLTLHAAKHDWSSLRWLCDIAQVLAKQTDLDWDCIDARLRGLRCEVLFHVSLHLAHLLLSAPLPPERGPRSPQVRRRVQKLAAQAVRSRLFPARERMPVLPGWPWQSLLFQGMQQPRDRWQLIYDTFFRPSALEIQMLPLPVWAAPLYALVRPLRLLVKHGLAETRI
jgi:hypothetical protein